LARIDIKPAPRSMEAMIATWSFQLPFTFRVHEVFSEEVD
jgi:hypothetical protein